MAAAWLTPLGDLWLHSEAERGCAQDDTGFILKYFEMIPSHTTNGLNAFSITIPQLQTSGIISDSRFQRGLPFLVVAVGFVVRVILARAYFLDPDEALHYLLASHVSLRTTYQAALTQAHPPLLILLLHYWRAVGHSEFILRTPLIVAGTGCCWLMYLWLRRIADRAMALIGLLVVTFAPALIEMSIEVRQYALLLFFVAGCLYFSERSVQENSLLAIVLFSLSLYGALLSHYSALLFAAAMGVYMLVRLYPYKQRLRLLVVWAVGQVVALAISGYFLITHVSRLEKTGMAHGIAETWLRRSIYHPGENNLAWFPFRQTLRVFTFTFSHGVIGTIGLLAFLAGLFFLLTRKVSLNEKGPTAWHLALLIALPFALNCAAAIVGLYPYGASRHNLVLAPFVVTGICFGLGSGLQASGFGLEQNRQWIRPTLIVAALAICNFFPAPPPLIRARNHKRQLMQNAVAYVRQSAQPGSVLVSDYESGLLLGYYLCGDGVVQDLPPYQPFSKMTCGPYTVIASFPGEWKFYGDDFRQRVEAAVTSKGMDRGSPVWFFNAGWIVDSTPAIRKALANPEPRMFGQNILVCEIDVRANSDAR